MRLRNRNHQLDSPGGRVNVSMGKQRTIVTTGELSEHLRSQRAMRGCAGRLAIGVTGRVAASPRFDTTERRAVHDTLP